MTWQRLWRDAESGREIPTAWIVQALELGLKADLEEWGHTLVRYNTDGGKTAMSLNVMVRGSVEEHATEWLFSGSSRMSKTDE